MSADSTVAEIDAIGGTALGVEVDVTDHMAVAGMVARVLRDGVASMFWSPMPAAVEADRWIQKASNLDPSLLQLVVGMNLFGTVYTVNAVAPVMKEQRSGKIITVSSVAGTAPSSDGRYAH